ncbi:MAG: hypothetical protein IK144_03070 [Bacteroidaceae bacterium]|nr:hypothetical protein [Bacteroidaceae bacterium]
MKQTKLFLTALLAGAVMMMVPQKAWADTATDEQYNAAISQITAGDYYIISTVYNETTYYLQNGGTLTNDLTSATPFQFTGGATTGGFKSTAWFIKANGSSTVFTNPADVNTVPDLQGNLKQNSRDRIWESQVLYYNGSKFAIRCTNATGSSYGPARFWTVTTKTEAEVTTVIAEYTETDNDAQFVWSFTNISNRERIEAGKIYVISGKYNSTTYYLNSSGYATSNLSEACAYTFTQGVGGDGKFAPAACAWHISTGNNRFTNANSSDNGSTVSYEGKLRHGTSSREWESQVLFYNGSNYAIRSTNATGTAWGAERFWTLTTNGNDEVIAEYTTTDNDAQYIWSLTEVDNALSNITKLYYIKSADFYNGNMYFKSVAGDGNALLRTNNTNDAGTYAVIPVSGQDNFYYLYDTKSKLFVQPAESATSDGVWKLSASAATPIYIQKMGGRSNDGTYAFFYRMAGGSDWDPQYANAYNGWNATSVANWGYNGSKNGDQWHIVEADDMTDIDITAITTNLPNFLASAAAQDLNVKYTGSVTNYGTLILPFAYTLPSGVDAYSELSVSGDAVQGTKINSGNEVSANTPVLLKGSGTFDVSGAAASVEDTYTSGILTGTYASYTTVAGDYVLQNQSGTYAFYKVNGTTPTVKPFRAYMPASVGGSAKAFTFNLDGVETAINEIVNSKLVNGKCYNLAGQRVSNPSRGIYVIGGRKVIVK